MNRYEAALGYIFMSALTLGAVVLLFCLCLKLCRWAFA